MEEKLQIFLSIAYKVRVNETVTGLLAQYVWMKKNNVVIKIITTHILATSMLLDAFCRFHSPAANA